MGTSVDQLNLPALKLDSQVLTSIVFESFDLPSSIQRTLGAPHASNLVIPLTLRVSTYDSVEFDLYTVIESVKSL